MPVEPKPTFTIKKKPNNVTFGSTLKERVLSQCFCLQVTGRVTFKQEQFKSRRVAFKQKYCKRGWGEEEEAAEAEEWGTKKGRPTKDQAYAIRGGVGGVLP